LKKLLTGKRRGKFPYPPTKIKKIPAYSGENLLFQQKNPRAPDWEAGFNLFFYNVDSNIIR